MLSFVNVISLLLSQSDHIKRLPLYLFGTSREGLAEAGFRPFLKVAEKQIG
jgi:hypothetical protein